MNIAIALLAGSAYIEASWCTVLTSFSDARSRPGAIRASNSIIDSGINMALRIRAARVLP